MTEESKKPSPSSMPLYRPLRGEAPKPRPEPPHRNSGPAPDEPFLNPYTFVPAHPRDGLPESLRDGKPPFRDRLHPDRWTGRIAVRLTTQTPLLLLDPARARVAPSGEEDHLTYPVLLRDGRPHFPATSVKGALRSAYETITDSRFGVFEAHDQPLGWRRVAGDALQMRPVRVITADAENDVLDIELMSHAVYHAYCDENKTQGIVPKHRQQVMVKLQGKEGRLPFIVEIRSVEQTRRGPGARGRENFRKGIAFVTGRNVIGKKCESVFLFDKDADTLVLHGMISRWDRLIGDYAANGLAGDGEPARRAADEGEELALSPHLWDEESKRLKAGSICYALFEGEEVVDLFPVLIPRDLSALPPAEMVHPTLRPAASYKEFSPADRVFGWVAPQGSGVSPAAYRGRVRIGPVACETDPADAVRTFAGDGLPLAILGSPKPSQGRFYWSDKKGDAGAAIEDRAEKEKIYRQERGLRGRKAYWHHAAETAQPNYWEDPGSTTQDPSQQLLGNVYREFRRPRKPDGGDAQKPVLTGLNRTFATTAEEQRDNQNRSVSGWINPGTEFTFTIDVQDLDGVELGALLWLLDLPDGHFHRMGFGKPLGFGSVRLTLDHEHTELHSTDQLRAYYADLGAAQPASIDAAKLGELRAEYSEILASHPGLREIEAAFLAVARGVDDLPVHYPRTRPGTMRGNSPTPPNPHGVAYEWFTANEEVAGKEIAPGRGRSLPPATASTANALRVYPAEPLKGKGNDSDNGGQGGPRGGRAGNGGRRGERGGARDSTRGAGSGGGRGGSGGGQGGRGDGGGRGGGQGAGRGGNGGRGGGGAGNGGQSGGAGNGRDGGRRKDGGRRDSR